MSNFVQTWTAEQIETLKAEYPHRPSTETAVLVGHSPIATRLMAHRLGIRRDGVELNRRPVATVPRETVWSPRKLRDLSALYYNVEDEKIAAHFNTTVAEIRRLATLYGFYKGPKPRRKPSGPPIGYVYLMRAQGTDSYKVGFTQLPVAIRLSSINVSSPTPIVLIGVVEGTYEDEIRYHERLASHHIRGEWFRLTEGDVRSLLSEFVSHGTEQAA